MLLQENISLAPLTTLKVGGPARYFVSAASEEELREAILFAREQNLHVFILGGGSNLVVADAGFFGLVIQITLKGVHREGDLFTAAAGEDWDAFVAHTVAAGYAGVECLSGIPGLVGGTPVQNVGAYGQEVSDTIVSVRVLDLRDLSVRDLSNRDCRFAYRSTIFNTNEAGRYVVLQVAYRLREGGKPHVEYADLKRHFAGRASAPTIAEVRDAVRHIRHSKGMLLVAGDPDCRSAGSFFKNPIVGLSVADALAARFAEQGKQLPRFAAADGHVKLSAAFLVEQAGFAKGTTRGRVGISSKHTLAIITREGATAAEVVALKDEIQSRVRDLFDISLQPEPVFLGF